ncbi:MAG: class B sortase [Lachnospiraceae bacterium]|nr:class B sortase [Lachnospiraceae bacterium]
MAKVFFLVLFSLGFLYSVISLAIYYYDASKAEAKIAELRRELAEPDGHQPLNYSAPDGLNEADGSVTIWTAEPEPGMDAEVKREAETTPRVFEIAARFRYLHSKNNDLVGWVSIANTRINYPVMQNKEDPLYYDRVNFDDVRDEIGLPYLDSRCEIAPKNQIQIIFGHNIRRRGLIFHDLTLYEDQDFWEKNQIINYDTLYDNGIYQIFAAIKYDARNIKKDDFQFHRYTHFSTAKGFDNTEHNFKIYKEQILKRALYDTKIDFDINDQYLILATCENSTSNSRFVIFAKQIYE